MESLVIPSADSEYSFELVVFQVGDKTFRVPRHGFDIPGASLPLPLERDEYTLHRLELDEGRFRALLRATYPFIGSRNLTVNDWLHALDLATEWKLVEVRNRAINALDSWVENQPAKKVVLLAKKYSILSWLEEAYIRLIQQEPLTTDELLSAPPLDWETIGRLLGANGTASINAVYQNTQGCCPLCEDVVTCNCQKVILQSTIEHEFKEEFKAIARAWPQMTDIPSLEDLEETDDDGPLHWALVE